MLLLLLFGQVLLRLSRKEKSRKVVLQLLRKDLPLLPGKDLLRLLRSDLLLLSRDGMSRKGLLLLEQVLLLSNRTNSLDFVINFLSAWSIIWVVLQGLKNDASQSVGHLCIARECNSDTTIEVCHCKPKANFAYTRNICKGTVNCFTINDDEIPLKDCIKQRTKGKHVGFFCVMVSVKFRCHPVYRANS